MKYPKAFYMDSDEEGAEGFRSFDDLTEKVENECCHGDVVEVAEYQLVSVKKYKVDSTTRLVEQVSTKATKK